MQIQLLQTHQALGWGKPQSLILVLHELPLCFSPRAEFPCVLPSTPCAPLHLCSPRVTYMRRHGSAWALALPTLALYVAHDPMTVCKMNVWVVPQPVCHGIQRAPCPRTHACAHTPPTTQTPPGCTTPGGLQGAPSSHQLSQGPALALGAPGILQLSHSWPCPRSPEPSLLCTADVPPSLGWCLEAPCMRSSLHRASFCLHAGQVPSALLFPPSPDLGVWVQPSLMVSNKPSGVGDSSSGHTQRSQKEK